MKKSIPKKIAVVSLATGLFLGGIGLKYTTSAKTIQLPTNQFNVGEEQATLTGTIDYDIESQDIIRVGTESTLTREVENNGKLIYLSDLPRMSKSSTKYGTILSDKTSSNAKISLKIGGTITEFDKGIWAHATSDVYYDLNNYQEYEYFQAYLGLNTTSNGGNGVTFIIYTSEDGENWTEKQRVSAMPNANATEVRINIKGANYLRLYANDNGANGKDHSVYADAKLTTANYTDGTGIPTIFELDDKLKSMDENNPDFEYTVLQREFVSRIGRNTLVDFINAGDVNKETLQWLMGDADTLGMYFYGSTPYGGYRSSLDVLSRLYQSYKADLEDTAVVRENVRNCDLYKRMIMAIAHTHSTKVRSFMPNTEEDGALNPNRNDLNNPQVSDPVRRYAVYKKMHLDGKLNSNFYKLEVEEIKLIMKTMISDYEIEWFRDYIVSRGGKYNHSWISYLIPFKFFNEKYYSEENKATWNNKYHFLEYGIPYKKYYAPQWLAFAEGTQCVGISNTSANAYNSMGIPAVTVSQPGHLAYAVMSMDANGNGSWQLYNSSFYWGESSHSITTFELANISQPVRQCPYNNRSLLGWGQQYSTGCSNLSYLAIAQEAVNDYENFEKAEKYVMAANAYTGDLSKQEEMYRKAISAQKINVDAWWGLVKLYANNSKYTEQDCLNLIKEFQTIYKTRPLAFYDFFNMLIGKIKDPMLNAEAVTLRTSTLQWAEVNGNNIHRGVAKILLRKQREDLATFSFDGQYAGQIRLGAMFNAENQPRWEYSLDGGKTWTEPDGLYAQLTPTEILGINENNHIKVRVIGTEVNATIKITRNLTIGNVDVWANDDENALFLYNSNKKVEWRYSDDSSGAAAWKKYDEIKPTLVGNRSIDVRFASSGTSLPSNFQNFKFTDNKYIAKETYIKSSNLSIADVSSETSSTPAINAVDANFGTWNDVLYVRDYSKWLSANDDENKFITIELKEPAYVSRLDYFPSDAQDHSTNKNKPKTGRIMQGEVLGSMDGENWEKLGDITNWANNKNTKTVKFTNPQKVRYVKVVVTETNDGYVGARGFNLYEDTTQGGPPTAEITYSITSKTGKAVVATIGNFSSDTVVVEEGITTYTFTENGAYTFHLRDTATGRTNEIVASVDWIDRTVPTAGVQYVDLPNTKGYVQAKIVNIDKNVFILDENDRPLRYIEKTNRYMYEFNFNPETKQVINMVQKDLNGNITLVRGYKLLDPTKPISNLMENPDLNFSMQLGNTTDTEYRIEYTAIYSGGKITRQNVFNDNLMNITSTKTEEEIEELRQKYTTGVEEDILKYVFTKNGEKTYKLRDRIGNVAEIKMAVDWINRGPYIAEISYDKEGTTNEDVTATLTFKEEGVRVTNLDEGAVEIENGAKYVFKDNGEFRFKMIDSEEVESYLDAKVTFIDKEVPNGIITYSTTNPTNGNIEATITFDKANVVVTNNEGSTTHTFTENGDFTFEFVDEAGNTNIAVATVDWIDRTAPTAELSYSTTEPTNQDVVVSIVDFSEDITVTNNNGDSTYTFTENGEFTFEFIDEAGNAGTVTAIVDWIDKEDIVPTISYQINQLTNENELATISFNKENVTIINNEGKNTYTFEENGSFTFEFRDRAGNTGTAVATVDWIDKEVPTAEVEYDIESATNQNVTAKLVNVSEEITITNNNGSNMYTFAENGSFTFEFSDSAGNIGTAVARVDWIDKTVPTAEVEYDITTATNRNVTAKLVNVSEEITITNNNGESTYTFTENGSITFEFRDNAGNVGTTTATVNWIDREEIVPTITYRINAPTGKNETATITFNKNNVTITNNDGRNTYTFEENGSFTFEFMDRAGNTGTATATVDWIDKTAPTAEIQYDRIALTNQNVTAKLMNSNKAITITNNGGKDTYVFTENGKFIFEFEDDCGNCGQAIAEVTNIDKTAPKATISYSTTEATTGEVVATLQLEDENMGSYPTIQTYTFNENGTHTFEYQDMAGNKGTIDAKVNWIYSGDVTVDVKYTKTDAGVEATLVNENREITVTNNNGNKTYLLTEENNTFTFEFEDKIGNKGAVVAKYENMSGPATIGYYKTSTSTTQAVPTTGNVFARIDLPAGYTVTNKTNVTGNNKAYKFEQNGSFTFEYTDGTNNYKATATVDLIDKEPITYDVIYSTTEPTSEDVEVTLKFNKKSGLTLRNAESYLNGLGVYIKEGAENTFIFTKNATITNFSYNYLDKALAIQNIKVEVNNIDKVEIEPTITYSTEEATFGSVTATIGFNKNNVKITNNDNQTSYKFTENGSFTFEYEDMVGHKGTATATVDWIMEDTEEVIPTIKYSTETLTNQDVIATIEFDQEGVTVEGGNTYTFTENGNYVFKYTDKVGRFGTAIAEVNWIDKKVPKATITYNITDKTNKPVMATITFDKENVTVEGGNTYIFNGNGEYTFNFQDMAGNKGTAVAKVDWINTNAPVGKITYSTTNPTNQDVVATVNFDIPDVIVEGGNTHTFTENGEYTFGFVGPYGNKGTAIAKVTWIDKKTPIATVKYDITNTTSQNVIATVEFDEENVTVEGGNTHTFTNNGTYTFKYSDEAGNRGTAIAEVTWIDKDGPVATITYSTTNPTNQNVIATISFDKLGVTVEGGITHVFTDNGEYTFEFVDSVGNRGTAVARVDWIDRKLPVATITYSTTNKTNSNVVATITFDKKNVEVEGGNTHTFTENGEYEFAFIGPAGNIGTAIAKVTWIDKEVPVGTISYDITKPTNQGVTATISFNKDDVVITNNDRNNTYTFTENGEFTFEFIDEAGNMGTTTARVTWIDKVLPVATIRYSTENPTSQDVTATISFNKENVEVEGGNTHIFTENGEYEFRFTGPAGNKGVAIARVTWIDKKAPNTTISYSTENPTNQDVIATISFDEENVTVKGGNTHTFTENGEYVFNFVDNAGNSGTAVARVDWIIRTLPNATFTYDITELTNKDVTVTIEFDREGTVVTNNDGNTTYTFTENGEYTFEFVGPYGNRGTATARVDWIDKKVPNATIEYDITELTNQDVTATIKFDKADVEVEGGNTHIFTESGEYTFKFIDKAGNKGEATAKVDWIRKTLPNATITYSTTNPTNQDVIATITFDIENVIVLGGNTHIFTENGEYTFEFVGPYGNRGTATAEVDWIDRVEPNATITYSTTNRTNQNVIATVTFDKENVTITNNNGSNEYTFTDNGEFEFEFVGPAGNKGVAVATVTWIDKTLPVGTITYSTEEPTNGDVIASITFNKENVVITNNNGSNEFTFTDNGEFEFEFIGPAGNEGTAIAKVDWIDRKVPEATITYSTTNPTNQGVIATISFDEENVKVEGGNEYTFTDNGEYIFKFTDKAGNSGMKMAKVTWIDRTLPIGTITYSTEKPTNGDVIASITFNKENVTITNNNGSNEYTFTDNGEFEFEFVGPAGNRGVALAKVDWIDKSDIEATVTYDITELTNQDVTASITFNKKYVTIVNNDGENTHTFTENGEFTFEYMDVAGNEGSTVAKVDWIDKEVPEATIKYSTKEQTSGVVIATITFDEEDITITNNDGMNFYAFEKNGEFTFEYVDNLGNKGTAIAKVDWIVSEIPTDKPSFNIGITSSETILNPGDEFEIEVSINDLKNIENGLIALTSSFEYDKNILDLVEIIGQNGWNIDKDSFNKDNFKFITENGNYITESGNIIKLKLKVKEGISQTQETIFKVISIVASNGKEDISAENKELKLYIQKETTDEAMITSEKYNIEENIITRILPETTFSKFKENVVSNRELSIINENNEEISDNDIIKTGMTLKVGEELEFTLIVIGDIDQDGTISVGDLAALKLHLIEKEGYILTGNNLKAADVDNDGNATIADLAQIKMILIGLLELE